MPKPKHDRGHNRYAGIYRDAGLLRSRLRLIARGDDRPALTDAVTFAERLEELLLGLIVADEESGDLPLFDRPIITPFEAETHPSPTNGSDGPATALFLVATMIRDAVNKYRDSSLQKDADELDRLTALFNLPPDRLVDAAVRECESARKPAGGEGFDPKLSPGTADPAPSVASDLVAIPSDASPMILAEEATAIMTGDLPGNEPKPFSLTPGTIYFACNRCNWTRERTIAICPGCRCPGYRLLVVDEAGILGPYREPDEEPKPAKPKRTRKPKAVTGPEPQCLDSTPVNSGHSEESAPLVPLPGQMDLPIEPGEVAETEPPILNEYEVHLEDDGQGNPTFLGVVKAANLPEAKRLAVETFGDELVETTPILVKPCKAHLDGRFTEVRECVACGERWPADQGVGCPSCVHGSPIEPIKVQAEPEKKPGRKRKEASHAQA